MTYENLLNYVCNVNAEQHAKLKREQREQEIKKIEDERQAEIRELKKEVQYIEPTSDLRTPVVLMSSGKAVSLSENADDQYEVIDNAASCNNQHMDREPGRPEERQAYLRMIWEKLEKPKRNEKIWSELRKITNQIDKGDCPVNKVFGRDQFSFQYKDGCVENIVHKTFQNDMTAIRKQK